MNGALQPGRPIVSRSRKGLHYVAEIQTLLRDSQPTYADIEGESDPRKQRERERARDTARVALIRIARDRKAFEQLSRPHQLEVRSLVDAVARQQRQLPIRIRKHFPTPKDGRPRDDHRRLLMAVTLRSLVNNGMTVSAAIAHSAGRFNVSERRAREIYSGSDLAMHEVDEWERLIRAELARREVERQADQARAADAALALPG
jgi:hypothetical protein